MWKIFQDEILHCVDKYVPKSNEFQKWNKPNWPRPLNQDTREKIQKEHRLWPQYMQSRNPQVYSKYKKIRNQVRSATREAMDEEQNEIAKCCKENP